VFAGVSEPIWSIHTKSSEWGHEMTMSRFTRSGIALLAGGKILQVVYAESATETNIASTTFTDANLTASITPFFSSSKILIQASVQVQSDRNADSSGIALRILRGSTAIFEPDPATHGSLSMFIPDSGASRSLIRARVPLIYLDSPAATTSTTYKVQGRASTTSNGGNLYCQVSSQISSILLMEVAA
jgi:hypothetical protein